MPWGTATRQPPEVAVAILNEGQLRWRDETDRLWYALPTCFVIDKDREVRLCMQDPSAARGQGLATQVVQARRDLLERALLG